MRHLVRTELRYPGLWRGCVGAFNPGLGPTGLSLRDWSGRGNHGTLETSAMWGVDRQSALVTTATTQFTTLPLSVLPSGSNSRSVSMWVRCTENARRGFIGNRPLSASNGWFFGELNSTTIWIAVIGVVGSVTATVPSLLNRVAHVGMTHDATSNAVVLYCDGAPAITATHGVGTQSTAAATYLGREQQNESPETLVGSILECETWSRVLSAAEMRILGRRPGIIYEMAPRRRSSSAVQFNRRRRLLLGST